MRSSKVIGICISIALLTGCGAPTATTPTAVPPAATAVVPTVAATVAPTDAPISTAPVPTNAPTAIATDAPVATAAIVPTPTFAPPGVDDKAIGEAAMTESQQAYADVPTVVGVIGSEGDYAAALAAPFKQRPQFVYLKRSGSGWETLFIGATPSGQQLASLGVPESLMSANDRYAVMDALVAQLQDERGEGVGGYLTVTGVAGDYARAEFAPIDPMVRDGFTSYLKRENDVWTQLSAGTAFFPEDLEKLGVPEELWTQANQ